MPGAKPHTSPDAISPLHPRPRPLSTVQAFGPPALRLGLSVAPPVGLGVPHELRLRRACRVGGGRAVWPCLRPLDQTARAVFPQAAFLRCSSPESSGNETGDEMGQ